MTEKHWRTIYLSAESDGGAYLLSACEYTPQYVMNVVSISHVAIAGIWAIDVTG